MWIRMGRGEFFFGWVHSFGGFGLRERWLLTCLLGWCRDAFAGGFVAGIVQGKSLEECVDMGHWLASLSITELGPSYVFSNPLFLSDPSEMLYGKSHQPPLPSSPASITCLRFDPFSPHRSSPIPHIHQADPIFRQQPLQTQETDSFRSSANRYPFPKQTYKPRSA